MLLLQKGLRKNYLRLHGAEISFCASEGEVLVLFPLNIWQLIYMQWKRLDQKLSAKMSNTFSWHSMGMASAGAMSYVTGNGWVIF